MVDEFKWATGSAEENICKTKNNNLMTIICFASLRIYYWKQREKVILLQYFISWWSQGKEEILVLPLNVRG